MTKLVFASIGLFIAMPYLFAGDTQPETDRKALLSCGAVTRLVDGMMRGSGERILMDQDEQIGDTTFRRGINKIYYRTSKTSKQLIQIEIEPIGEETPETSKLAAAFLSALSAVESIEEGTKLAHLLTDEIEKDGRPRSISLGNGMKFMKVKTENSVPKYVINM